ncbi:sugar phosphate isomerase/epimerase family protein [Pseudomonas luteola]
MIKATIDRFAPFCTGIPVITNTGALGQSGNEAEVWEGCIKHYRELADHAADKGLSIAIEPLSPPMMSRDSILYTFMQGYELVQAVARENVGLCLDLYNSWQDADLTDAIRLAGDRIFLTQLSDWQRPRSYLIVVPWAMASFRSIACSLP